MAKSMGKKIALIGGVCAITSALSDYGKSKTWKGIHTIAVIGGGAAAILGTLS